MTELLEKAFAAVRALPDAEQDAIASRVLAEIRERDQRARVFARSSAVFAELYGDAATPPVTPPRRDRDRE